MATPNRTGTRRPKSARRTSPAASSPRRGSSPPPDKTAPIPDLIRNIELVIRDNAGNVLARSGLFFSDIEAHFLAEHEIADHFELSFEPGKGVKPPAGYEWRAGGWCRWSAK